MLENPVFNYLLINKLFIKFEWIFASRIIVLFAYHRLYKVRHSRLRAIMDPIVLSLNFDRGCLMLNRLRLLPNQPDGRRVMAFDFICEPHLLVKIIVLARC